MKNLLIISLLFVGLSSCNQKSEIQQLTEKFDAENKTADLKSEQKMRLLELNMSEWSLSRSNLPYEEWAKTHPIKTIDEVIQEVKNY